MDGRELKVVDMLDLTAEEIGVEFADDRESKWELQYELALTYDGLGVFEPAVDLLQEIREEIIESDSRETEMALRTLIALQRSLHSLAKYEQASHIAAEATELAGLRELVDTLSTRTLLATCQRTLGLFEEAASWLEPTVAEAVEQYGNNQPRVIDLLQEYASILMKLKRYEESIEIFGQQLAICNELLGEEHGRTQQIKSNLASTLVMVGRQEEAIKIYREVVTASEKSQGADSPHTAISRYLLAQQLVKVGNRTSEIVRHSSDIRGHQQPLDQ